MNQHPSLSEEEYQALAEFRYLLRSYLHFSETAIRSMGLRPQQYLLLLAIKGMPKGREPTMSMLAKRMQLAPQTLVELADRVTRRTTGACCSPSRRQGRPSWSASPFCTRWSC